MLLDNLFVVSVPLRGYTYLNEGIMSNINVNKSFRPLTGLYISKPVVMISSGMRSTRFRPLTGLYISKLFLHWTISGQFRFRPLTGLYISKR